jgi:repressor LexA
MLAVGGKGMRELTERQQDVLTFIGAFTVQHGMPPTVREIGERFRVTPRAAFDHLRALERKGALKRRESAGRTSRALTVARPPQAGEFRRVPVLGRIAAGAPLLAEEHRDGELPLAASALPGPAEDFFALRVRGDSMIGAHICDGDLVIVRKQSSAEPNEIVVAMLGEGAEAREPSRSSARLSASSGASRSNSGRKVTHASKNVTIPISPQSRTQPVFQARLSGNGTVMVPA